jgi:hypothetical protein
MEAFDNIVVICHNGNHYVFKNDGTETTKMLHDRAWWIVKNLGKADFSHLVNLSKVMANQLHFGVEYPDQLTNEIETLNKVYD